MQLITDEYVIHAIQNIFQYLVDGNFHRLMSDGYLDERIDRFDAIQEIIETYPRNITMPPDSYFRTLEKLEFPKEQDEEETYTTEPELWYSGETSELYCRIFCTKKLDDSYEVYLYNVLS